MPVKCVRRKAKWLIESGTSLEGLQTLQAAEAEPEAIEKPRPKRRKCGIQGPKKGKFIPGRRSTPLHPEPVECYGDSSSSSSLSEMSSNEELDVDVTGIESTESETEVPTPNDALSDELLQKLQEPFSDISSISADEMENITKNADDKQVER